MKPGLLLFSFYIAGLSHAQGFIPCTRHYNTERQAAWADSIFYSIPNILFINFNSSFDDSAIISINNHVIHHINLKTDYPIDLAGRIAISFKDSTDCKIMKVYFVKAGKYFTEKPGFRFKALDIWTNKQGPWQPDYFNHFPLREQVTKKERPAKEGRFTINHCIKPYFEKLYRSSISCALPPASNTLSGVW